MLPLSNRIRKNPQYKIIYKAGNKFYSKNFTLIILSTGTQEDIKFGIVASKKVGNAVTRNKLKRQTREIVRKYIDQGSNGIQIAIIIKQEAVDATYAQLESEIDNILGKKL